MKVTPHIGGNCSPHLCKLLSTLVEMLSHIRSEKEPLWYKGPSFQTILLCRPSHRSWAARRAQTRRCRIAPLPPIQGLRAPLCLAGVYVYVCVCVCVSLKNVVLLQHCLQHGACALLCVWQVCVFVYVCVGHTGALVCVCCAVLSRALRSAPGPAHFFVFGH